MVWNIGAVDEYESQSAIIPLVDIIIQNNMSCGNNVTSFLLVGVLRQKLTLAGDKMCCL
jgi:hypothetical protein